MAFSIKCDNKGCGKLTDPLVDKVTNECFCADCGKEIKHVTDFAKRQMIFAGQVKKAGATKKQSWAIKCAGCNTSAQPVLKDNKLCCSSCSNELTNISGPVQNMLKFQLKAK